MRRPDFGALAADRGGRRAPSERGADDEETDDDMAADLSTCDRCGRPLPASNRPEFAEWRVIKGDDGTVVGMRCPRCQAAEDATG